MLLKLCFKILLKACIPVIAMIGIVSYLIYFNGGDPGAMAKSVLSRASFGSSITDKVGKIGDSVSDMGNDITSKVNNSARSLTGDQSYDYDAPPRSRQIYQWTDASGVAHFGNQPPAGARNLKKIKLSSRKRQPAQDRPTKASSSVPGVPGVSLPGGIKLPEGVDYSRILGQINEQ